MRHATDGKKRSIFDSGFDLLFKKHTKPGIKEISHPQQHQQSPQQNSQEPPVHHNAAKKHHSITDHLFHRNSNPFRHENITLDSKDDHHNHAHQHQQQQQHQHQHMRHSGSGSSLFRHNDHHDHNDERKSWKPFENIKIYTDKNKSSEHGNLNQNGKFLSF